MYNLGKSVVPRNQTRTHTQSGLFSHTSPRSVYAVGKGVGPIERVREREQKEREE